MPLARSPFGVTQRGLGLLPLVPWLGEHGDCGSPSLVLSGTPASVGAGGGALPLCLGAGASWCHRTENGVVARPRGTLTSSQGFRTVCG